MKSITGCGIYAIGNQVTGNGYIGSSINLARRLREHFRLLAAGVHESPKLQTDYSRDGVDAFRAVLLDRCSPDELPHLEEQFIAAFNAVEDGYNALSGPFSYGFRGGHHRPETRAKMVEAHKRSGLAERNRQRVWTEEMRHQVSDAVKRLWADPTTRAKWVNSHRTLEASKRSTRTNLAREFKLGAWARDSGHLARLAENMNRQNCFSP